MEKYEKNKLTVLYPLDINFLNSILERFTDSTDGASYWQEKIGKTIVRKIDSFDNFKKYCAFKNREEQMEYENHLRKLPVENFIPLSTQRDAKWLWASETGGTTGIAKRGTWSNNYWKQIMEFSNEFLDLHGIPWKENWLFIGPTGPHTTGRLLISIAERRGGKIFCIDMDPRIVRIFIKEKKEDILNRYIQHVWEQVVPIIKYQRIGVIFCTASLLELMPQYIDLGMLKSVKAVLHAGLSMSKDTHKYLRETIFSNKPIVGIYGTSVSGISFQKPYEAEDDYKIIYIPSQPYIVLECINDEGEIVNYQKEGYVRCFRFTDDQLIPGFIERDIGTRVKPYGKYANIYNWDWLGDPHSPESLSGQKIEGVY
jgi:thienamycin biosynthesis protein ThnN